MEIQNISTIWAFACCACPDKPSLSALHNPWDSSPGSVTPVLSPGTRSAPCKTPEPRATQMFTPPHSPRGAEASGTAPADPASLLYHRVHRGGTRTPLALPGKAFQGSSCFRALGTYSYFKALSYWDGLPTSWCEGSEPTRRCPSLKRRSI